MLLRLTIDAFPLGPDLTRALEALRGDPRFSRSRVNVLPGGLGGATDHYRTASTPQLLIVEDEGDVAQIEARLALLAEVCVAGTQLLVVGKTNDIATYRRLLALGVGDYLVSPVGDGQLAESVAALFAEPGAAPAGRLIAFMGSRGGVGSSALAHNVAWLLSQPVDKGGTGDEVIAVDLDIAFGTLGLAFNVEARQTVGGMLGEPGRVDAQMIERVIVAADDKLQLLPSPGMTRHWQQIDVDEIDRFLELLRRMAPTVVIDLPHHWTPWVAHALELADEAVIVAPPDLAGLRDAKGLLDALAPRRAQREPVRLAINKADLFKKAQLSGKDFEEALKLAPAVTVPFDPAFADALNEGQVVARTTRNSRLSEALLALTRLVGPRALRQAAAPKSAFVLSEWLRLSRLSPRKG